RPPAVSRVCPARSPDRLRALLASGTRRAWQIPRVRSGVSPDRMDTQRAHELPAPDRARIERGLADVKRAGEDDDPDPFDPADVAPDLLDAEVGEGVAVRLREELAAVKRAEDRLAHGTYGISIESGRPIPEGRLETLPWAERTADEQALYDRSAGS